jgi:hypothetical protein
LRQRRQALGALRVLAASALVAVVACGTFAHAARGGAPAALQTGESAAQREPTVDWDSVFSRAGQLANEQRYGEAGAVLEEALGRIAAVDEQSIEARRFLSGMLAARGESRQALAQLDRTDRDVAALRARAPTNAALQTAALELELSVALERGQVLWRMGLLDLASSELSRANELAKTLGSPKAAADAAFYCASVMALAQDFTGALELLSDDSLRALDDAGLRAQALAVRGWARSELLRDFGGDDAAARADLEAALELGRDDRAVVFAAERDLCDLAIRARRFDEARTRLARLDASSERLAKVALEGELRERRVKQARLRSWLARASGAPRADLEAALTEIRGAVEATQSYWSLSPERPGGVGMLQVGDWRCVFTEYAALLRQLAPEDGAAAREAFEALARFQALGSLARALGAADVTLSDVRSALLPGGTCLLLYLPGLEDTHIFGVDGAEFVHAVSGSHEQFLEAARTLDELVSRAPEAGDGGARARELESSIRGLSELAFPSEIRRLVARSNTVLALGVDLIGDAALEVLDCGAVEPLGCAKAVVRLPSLPVGVFLARQVEPRVQSEFTLVAAPLVGPRVRGEWPELREIPWSDEQTERVAIGVDASARQVFLGAEATPAAFFAALQPEARVLCVVTHGVFDAQRRRDGERPACLALAPDATGEELVACAQIESRRSPPLVELIACGAARGPARMGDDLGANLGGAFLLAGARTVVLGRADMSQRATLELVGAARREMGRGANVAEAWRRARSELRSTARTSDPYYWGSITIVGSAQPFTPVVAPIAPNESTPRWIWIAACSSVLALLGWQLARWRRRAQRSVAPR